MTDFYFVPADAIHLKRERAKARELRGSQWWKQQLGKGICYHCEQRFDAELLTMDHVLPLARGGKSSRKNVVVACKDCNSKKKYKTSAEMALEALNERTIEGTVSVEDYDE